MSEYIHEIVLQEYIIEKISHLNLSVSYKGLSRMKLVDAMFNNTGTFWDLSGKLENGDWIPIEVEWTTKIFFCINIMPIKISKNSKVRMAYCWF